MDTYLPADFHRLHEAAAEDWRDASSSPLGFAAARPCRGDAQREAERVVDPSWLAI